MFISRSVKFKAIIFVNCAKCDALVFAYYWCLRKELILL